MKSIKQGKYSNFKLSIAKKSFPVLFDMMGHMEEDKTKID